MLFFTSESLFPSQKTSESLEKPMSELSTLIFLRTLYVLEISSFGSLNPFTKLHKNCLQCTVYRKTLCNSRLIVYVLDVCTLLETRTVRISVKLLGTDKNQTFQNVKIQLFLEENVSLNSFLFRKLLFYDAKCRNFFKTFSSIFICVNLLYKKF